MRDMAIVKGTVDDGNFCSHFFPVIVCQERNIKWKVFELDSDFFSSVGSLGFYTICLIYKWKKLGYIPECILQTFQNSNGIIFSTVACIKGNSMH